MRSRNLNFVRGTSGISLAPSPTCSEATGFLDGVRGLSALYVCMHHASYMLMEGPLLIATSGQQPLPLREQTVIGSLTMTAARFLQSGHAVVTFFFVLSGFVIHLAASRSDPDRFHPGRFLVRRIWRLYPPLVFALLLTAVCDACGKLPIFTTQIGETPYVRLNKFTPDDSFPRLAQNLLFLMPLGRQTYGTNGVLWSLSYEWWFYVAYPLLFRLWCSSRAGAAVVALGATALASIMPDEIAGLRSICIYFPVWWIGTVVADVYLGRGPGTPERLWPCVILIVAAFVPDLLEQIRAILLGFGFAGLIWGGIALQRRCPRSMQPLESLRWLGSASYSLYLLHMPIFMLISVWLMSRDPQSRLPSTPWVLIPSVLLVVAIAWLTSQILERPFARARVMAKTP